MSYGLRALSYHHPSIQVLRCPGRAKKPDHAGGVLMSWPTFQWPRRRKASLVSPAQAFNLDALELQTAKEILAEIFRARPEDIEDMIQRRLGERSRREEHEWPAAFLLE